MTDRDAEMDALVQPLGTAGLLETFTDDDGDEAMRLTPEGERVARQLAMSDDNDQDALMEALLGEGSDQRGRARPSRDSRRAAGPSGP